MNLGVFKRHSFIYNNIPKTLSLFYFLITVLSLPRYLPEFSIEKHDSLSPPPLLSFIEYLSPNFILFLVNITPVILLLTGMFPKYRSLRVLSALFYTFVYGMHCSHGINYHDQLTHVYCAIAGAFIPTWKKEETQRINKHISIIYFWVFHAMLLFPYFISGLTKLFIGGFYQLFFDDISIFSLMPCHISHNTTYQE